MTESSEKIRIALHINTLPGEAGGVAPVTQGLVSALGKLDGPEQYLLTVQTSSQAEWIRQYAGPNQQVVIQPKKFRSGVSGLNGANPSGTFRERVKSLLRPAVRMIRSGVGILTPRSPWPDVPVSNGYYESLGCDVLHFPTQEFILCSMPTIYNPHDLQHLHYPQFWHPEALAWRETIYHTACQFARTVVVGSEWIKQDVVRQYRVHPEKVQIIPWAPPTLHYPETTPAEINDARRSLSLPSAYALYPAVTWPHKNHLRLLEAIAELRDSRNLQVNLVCTGARDETHWPAIQRRVKELNLSSQITFLGFLSEVDLRAVFRLAQFLVLPSLFEADSCPIYEAWSEGLPVASSNHTALPDQVGDAGLLFDARSVPAIADALQKMSTDAAYREELVQRGYRRVKDFSWERTAKAFRAVYRRAAGLTLGSEDRWLLQWDWMREPHRNRLNDEAPGELLLKNRSASSGRP